jgi:tryptophan synthase alpha chain
MNGIDARFQLLKERGQPAFIPYITAGDPTLDRTEELVYGLERAGADIIELGVPFSDPVADGVVNQEAAQRALRHHVTLHDIVARVKRIRARSQVPLVLFTYYNPVLAYGVEAFAADAAAAGVDGVLCVDLPVEEADDYRHQLQSRGVHTIFLIAPTSTDARMQTIARASSGFIYYVSRTGVTGERASVETSVAGMIAKIKLVSSNPVAVGFGISTPDQAAEVAGYADGVVVGSAIVRMIGALGDQPEMVARVGEFAHTLAEAAHSS